MDRTNILRLLLGATLAAFVAATAYGDAQKVPPDAASGGGIAASDNVDWTGSHSFLDGTYFSLKDDVDPTKILRFQLSGITTGTVRTITVPDANLTLPTAFIGGSTGATDNAILRADGTGGGTLDGGSTTPPTYDDSGNLLVETDGTSTAPSLLVGQSDTGFASSSSEFYIIESGVARMNFQGSYIKLPSSAYFVWTTGAATGTTDIWFGRGGSGTLNIWSGAGSALGYLLHGIPIEVNTTTKSPTVNESGECYTNTGDADGSTINLPNDPTIGSRVCALLTVSQAVTIVPAAGETISDNGTAYSTSCVADALGESIELVAATGGSGATWVPKSKVGTWTCS